MSELRIGDQVKYIDGMRSILFDQDTIYIVNDVSKLSTSHPYIGISGFSGYFAARRFEVVTTYPTLRCGYV